MATKGGPGYTSEDTSTEGIAEDSDQENNDQDESTEDTDDESFDDGDEGGLANF